MHEVTIHVEYYINKEETNIEEKSWDAEKNTIVKGTLVTKKDRWMSSRQLWYLRQIIIHFVQAHNRIPI